MRSVRLNFLLMLFLILSLSYRGYADCPGLVASNTELEAILGGNWVKEIKVQAIKDQGIDGYFYPKIRVCAYDGKSYCHDLQNGESCRTIYGTQSTGGGISAAALIDWEGDKMLDGGKIKEGIAKDLKWEWADGVTDEEKIKFARSPKICACSQKSACISGASATFARWGQGANIFRPGDMDKVCDTCYQKVIKCAPIPLAPGPPPFCDQLAMSPSQVRIVPITNKDNDYFHPRVGVIIGETRERRELPFPRVVSSNENIQSYTYPVPHKDAHHYFKTYRKKGQLCTEYYGTEKEESKRRLQFPARCFPAPPAPELEEVSIPKPDEGKGENTLKVKMKMSENVCTYDARGTHSNGICTFYVNKNSPTYIGHLSLTVVKPAIVKKTIGSDNRKSNIDDIIKGILASNTQQFKVLKERSYVPDIETKCKESQGNKCKLDNLGHPKIEVKYKENSKSKMLCLSGWQPEPEEFVVEREGKIIPLKLMGASYAKYNSVFSKESNQFYYFPCNETIDVLAEPQSKLDEIIFNKRGYVFIPDENKDRDNCLATEDKEIDTKQNCDKCKIVYELIDGKDKEKDCKQDQDGCFCFDKECSRSTQYEKDNKPFYLKISQEQSGVVKQLEQPIKANRTEVFYADKLCRFDLEGLKNRLREIIVARLKDKKQKLEKKNQKPYDLGDGYTDDLSIYDYVEIEAWGGGEAGHIKDIAQFTESRPGMPGDYIKAKLKIDPSYPVIKVKVTEGGGGQEDSLSNKDGGPTLIEMCSSHRQDCQPLITVAGGGKYRVYGGKDYKNTTIHEKGLKLEEKIIKGDKLNSTENNKVAYIEDSEIKYKNVTECNKSYPNGTYGAGGCINKSRRTYSKGSPGYVKIKPMLDEINEDRIQKINDAIEQIIQNPDNIKSIDDPVINKLDGKIINTIEEEIKKELLGL